jgi:hypothetical protein
VARQFFIFLNPSRQFLFFKKCALAFASARQAEAARLCSSLAASCSSVMDRALAVKAGDYSVFPAVSPAKKAILPSGWSGA